MKPARTSAKVIKGSERQSKAYALRLQGKTLKEVAVEVGVSTATAQRLVDAEISRVTSQRDDSIKKQQQVVSDRLDYLIRALWERVEQGDVNAISAVTKIEERRCKLLGLDEPQRIQASVELEGMADHELVAVAQRLGLSLALSLAQAQEPEIEALPGEVLLGGTGNTHVEIVVPAGSPSVDSGAQDSGSAGGQAGE